MGDFMKVRIRHSLRLTTMIVFLACSTRPPAPLKPDGAYVAELRGILTVTFVFHPDGLAMQMTKAAIPGGKDFTPNTMSWWLEGERVKVRSAGGETWTFLMDGRDLLLVERNGEPNSSVARYAKQQ
jgi:hypothetical protein